VKRYAFPIVTAWAALIGSLPLHAGPERFEKTIQAYEAKDKVKPPPSAPVLFVGSSTFRGWNGLEQDFAPLPAINRGFGGSTMRDVLHFFDRVVLPYKPRLIVVYEGDNDLVGAKSKAETFIASCETFINRVHEEIPETQHIFFIPPKPSVKRWHRWPEMKKASDMLKELAAADPAISVIDTSSTLLGTDGKPDPALFRDGLHMTAEGNARWVAIIKPLLEKALAE